jgi:hypothetical protein
LTDRYVPRSSNWPSNLITEAQLKRLKDVNTLMIFFIRTALTLHIPSTSHHNSLSTNISKQRTGNSQNRARSLSRSTRTSKRDIWMRGWSTCSWLSAWDSQCNLCTIRQDLNRTLLLRLRQPCQDISKSNGVCANTESWAPFFGDCLCETGDTGFGDCVVGLTCVAVDARCGGDVDDVSWFAVLDAEVRGSSSNQLEWSTAVEGEDCIPLLIGCLMYC